MFYKKLNNPASKTLSLVLIAALLYSTACTTTRVVSSRVIEPQPETLQNKLKKGDLVKITTKKGVSFELRIADLSSEAIISSDEILELGQRIPTGGYRAIRQIPFTEIAKIEKLIEMKRPSPERTAILVIIWAALIVRVLVVAAEFDKNCCGVGDLGGN